jgi:hypothetical protein
VAVDITLGVATQVLFVAFGPALFALLAGASLVLRAPLPATGGARHRPRHLYALQRAALDGRCARSAADATRWRCARSKVGGGAPTPAERFGLCERGGRFGCVSVSSARADRGGTVK